MARYSAELESLHQGRNPVPQTLLYLVSFLEDFPSERFLERIISLMSVAGKGFDRKCAGVMQKVEINRYHHQDLILLQLNKEKAQGFLPLRCQELMPRRQRSKCYKNGRFGGHHYRIGIGSKFRHCRCNLS